MKIYILSIFMLISVGLSAQTIISKSQTTGNWTSTGTWWPSPFIAPPNTSVDQIVILAGNTVSLTGNVDLVTGAAAGHAITLIVRGTLKMYESGWFGNNTTYELALPEGSSIIVEDGGKIDGDNTVSFLSGLLGTSTITAGGEELFNHAYGAQGQSSGDLTAGSGEVITVNQGGSSLPVELLSFDSEINNKTIKLYWQTASELNSDYFELERSADGENWEVLGRLAAAGNSNTQIDYSFIDQNPLMGDNYYRLHQVDFDDKDEYFGPIHQRYANEELNVQLRIYPNPNTDGQLTIKTNSNMMLGDVIEIYDVAGRLQKTITVSEEINTMQLNISDLKKGVYITRYQNQEIQLTERLIIQ